jgi:hypothetical protein
MHILRTVHASYSTTIRCHARESGHPVITEQAISAIEVLLAVPRYWITRFRG